MNSFRGIRRILRRLWVTAGLAFTAWVYFGFQASGVPDAALTSDAHVRVTRSDDGIEFRSLVPAQPAGLIFLPGAMVEPAAYAPLLKTISGAGYSAHLVYLPMRSAWTDSQRRKVFGRIRKIMTAEPGTKWVLAGHSRGGMLASRFVHEDGAGLAGLALIGTTHPRDFSLADARIPVTKIFGSRDGVAGEEAIRNNLHLLPQRTTLVRIEGGNHVQFGYYRHQLGDDPATISLAEQQRQASQALIDMLSRASHSR